MLVGVLVFVVLTCLLQNGESIPQVQNSRNAATASDGKLTGKTQKCGIPYADIEQRIGVDFKGIQEGLKTDSILLLDVRTLQELKDVGEIEGSVNIPLAEIDDAFGLDKETFQTKYGFPKPSLSDEVVLSCGAGVRAYDAWQRIEPLGYCNAKVYYGSFDDWIAKGGPIVFNYGENSKS